MSDKQKLNPRYICSVCKGKLEEKNCIWRHVNNSDRIRGCPDKFDNHNNINDDDCNGCHLFFIFLGTLLK